MKAAERIESQYGNTMLESLGVRPLESSSNTPPKVIAMASPEDGRNRHREAALLDIETVVPDPNNIRKTYDEEALRELAENIKARGQIAPGLVRWNKDLGKWVIIAGHRRFEACKRAAVKTYKAVCIEADVGEDEIVILQLSENLQREDLKPVELARTYQSILDAKRKGNSKYSLDDLSAEVNKSKATISRTLSLLKLPEDLQERVNRGELPASVAYEIARSGTADEQRQEADRFVSEGLTRDDITGKKKQGRAAEAPEPEADDLPAKKKPATWSAPVGNAVVTIKWQKSRVNKKDIIAALEAALSEVRGEGDKPAE